MNSPSSRTGESTGVRSTDIAHPFHLSWSRYYRRVLAIASTLLAPTRCGDRAHPGDTFGTSNLKDSSCNDPFERVLSNVWTAARRLRQRLNGTLQRWN